MFVTLPHSIADYNYTSTIDPYAARSQDNFTMLTAGKALGGSDTINHFLHIRGSPSDYDSWAEVSGDDSWKYNNILKYFIKSERVDDKEILKEHPDYHGTKGPMGLTRQVDNNELGDYLKAFGEAGNPVVLDLNANQSIGYTQPQYMLADRKRQTPAYTYLRKVQDNPNFHVSKNTRVTRILFKNNVAVAVEAVYHNRKFTFKANKEIILSAGVFNTPQILMLSGIGPENHLKSKNLEVISNLPVGENLMDQVTVTIVYKTKKYSAPLLGFTRLEPDLTKIPFNVIVGTASLNKSDVTNADYQTYNLLFAHDTPLLTLACRPAFGYRDDICDGWNNQVRLRDSFFNLILNVQPKSRGTVRLRSTDPFDDPEITMNYFTEPEDLEDMLKYVKDFIRIGETKTFKKMKAEIVGLDLPECADKDQGSDEFWKCYILNRAISVFHSSCTCPMGTVVDGQLKIKGFEKIRIVDASVMPKVPKSAPNAAIIMLAEKAADMIKNQL